MDYAKDASEWLQSQKVAILNQERFQTEIEYVRNVKYYVFWKKIWDLLS